MKKLKKLIYIVLLANVLFILYGKYFNPPITITQIGGWLEFNKMERKYIPYEEMGDYIKIAVIASEDQRYFQHNGFDFESIEKVIKENKDLKTVRGASTISQQTAKNVFLWQGRSWIRKGLETFYTFVIENIWGKKAILERYLNCIEMGRGVFGIEAASHYYFNKSAKNLTKSEAAWIATILPNPKKYDPKNPTPRLKRKHAWVLRQMNNIGKPKDL